VQPRTEGIHWSPFGHLFEDSFNNIARFLNVKINNDYNYKQLLIGRAICGVSVPGTKEILQVTLNE